MGLDGGTKITRSDVLRGQSWRMAQKDTSRSTRGGSVNQVFQEQQLDQQARRAILWSSCALSGLPLIPPLVADALGQLMNRQAVLEHLLAARSSCDDEAAQLRYSNQLRAAAGAWEHLKSTKDVFTVHLTPNPELQLQQRHGSTSTAPAAAATAALAQPGHRSSIKPNASNGSSSSSAGPAGSTDKLLWICPVTLLPAGNKQPFSAIKPCGHVLSDKAIAATSAAEKCCPVCEVPFEQQDIVLINGSQEHMDGLRQRLRAAAAARAAAKAEKAAKQKKRPQQLSLESDENGGSDGRVLELPATAAGAAAAGGPASEQQLSDRCHKAARLVWQ